MSNVRSAVIGCIVAFATSLLLARVHPFGDAGLNAQPHGTRIMDLTDIPPNIRETLMTKCADCHSTQTKAPLYSLLAPFSWLMERDVVRARKAMNLSQWNNYSDEERDAFKVKIHLETKSNRMPLLQYRILHWNTRITDVDIDSLSEWARQSTGPAALRIMQATTEGDAVRGKEVFERRCTGCHSLDQNREGPHLRGVFGRTSGSVSDFVYSAALKQAHITWNDVSLERWLTDPDAFVPANNMEFRVIKPEDRRDVIRFLKEGEHH